MGKSAFGPAGDQLAVAKHGDVVGERHDVRQDVRDVDDRLAGLAQAADQREEPRGLARGQRGRRLVEDDDLGIELQRLGDLDELPLAGRQPLDRRVRRRGRGSTSLSSARVRAASARAVDQRQRPDARRGKSVDEDVLGDRSDW